MPILAVPAYLTPSIDIVLLRQRQFCSRIRFTHHSICFDDLNCEPSHQHVCHQRWHLNLRMFLGLPSSLAFYRCTSYPSCQYSYNSLQVQLVCAVCNSERSQCRQKLWTQRLSMFGERKSVMEILSTMF